MDSEKKSAVLDDSRRSHCRVKRSGGQKERHRAFLALYCRNPRGGKPVIFREVDRGRSFGQEDFDGLGHSDGGGDMNCKGVLFVFGSNIDAGVE